MTSIDLKYLETGRRQYFSGAGAQISAIEFGAQDGPVMVLVHGMKDHSLSLFHLIQAFRHHRVISVDLRGHGYSDNPGS